MSENRPPPERFLSGRQRRHSVAGTNSSDRNRKFSFKCPRWSTVISNPSPSLASDTSRHSSALTSERRNPPIEQQPGDHGVGSAAAVRRGVGFDAPAVLAWAFGGGENGGESVRAERSSLAPAPVGGCATVASQYPGGDFPGRRGLVGEAGAKLRGGHGKAGARGRFPGEFQIGKVSGEGVIGERPAFQPGVKLA